MLGHSLTLWLNLHSELAWISLESNAYIDNELKFNVLRW